MLESLSELVHASQRHLVNSASEVNTEKLTARDLHRLRQLRLQLIAFRLSHSTDEASRAIDTSAAEAELRY